MREQVVKTPCCSNVLVCCLKDIVCCLNNVIGCKTMLFKLKQHKRAFKPHTALAKLLGRCAAL